MMPTMLLMFATLKLINANHKLHSHSSLKKADVILTSKFILLLG